MKARDALLLGRVSNLPTVWTDVLAGTVLAGGALLLTPGIITDALGFGLLFPATRHVMQKRIMGRLEQSIQEGAVQVRMAEGEIFSSPSAGE